MVSNDRPTIFITGATGFFGTHIATALAAQYPQAFFKIAVHRTPPRFAITNGEFIPLALENTEQLTHALMGVTTVIHCAALTHASSPSMYERTNVHCTQNLMTAAHAAGVTRVIHISSRAITDDCGWYARSKRIAEEIVIASGIPYCILRFSEIYAPACNEGIGTIVKLVRSLPVVAYPAGNIRVAPLSLSDAVQAVTSAYAHPELTGRTFLIAGPNEYTLHEVIAMLARTVRRYTLIIPIPVFLIALVARIISLLGITIIEQDQIDRMCCPKATDITDARALLCFNPIPFSEGLTSLIAPPVQGECCARQHHTRD